MSPAHKQAIPIPTHPLSPSPPPSLPHWACTQAQRPGLKRDAHQQGTPASHTLSVQVVEPKVTAWLYSWGEGRVTAEGEHIPCRIEELEIGYIDGMMCAPTATHCCCCSSSHEEHALVCWARCS